jgi:hypothetical protein
MADSNSRGRLEAGYHAAVQAYLRGLPIEHFAETVRQGQRRTITLASLDLVSADRPDFHVFNEMLVQYPDAKADRKIGKVVPDNMVVIHDGPLDVEGYSAIELQPAKPFWVLEYVSKSTERKDYEDNMVKYESMLKVPYYLLFYPDDQDLSLFKYRKYKKQYSSVLANEHERFAIPGVRDRGRAARRLGAVLVPRRTAAATGGPSGATSGRGAPGGKCRAARAGRTSRAYGRGRSACPSAGGNRGDAPAAQRRVILTPPPVIPARLLTISIWPCCPVRHLIFARPVAGHSPGDRSK